MSVTREQISSLQTSYCLQACKNQGGLLWIRDWGLRLGIIVGQDDNSTMWMVVDQPSKMYYHIQPLSAINSTDYYIDFDNPQIDKEATILLACDLLKQYNAYNGQKYDSFHKVTLPENNLTESQKADWKAVVMAKMNGLGQSVVANSIGRLNTLNQAFYQLLARQEVAVEPAMVSESKSIELQTKENVHRQIA